MSAFIEGKAEEKGNKWVNRNLYYLQNGKMNYSDNYQFGREEEE